MNQSENLSTRALAKLIVERKAPKANLMKLAGKEEKLAESARAARMAMGLEELPDENDGIEPADELAA